MTESAEQDVVALLRELIAWQRFSSQDNLRTVLQQVLTTDNDRATYEHTDGTRKRIDVSRAVGISDTAVGQKWKAWRTRGLLLDDETGNPRHLASLASLGGLDG